MSDIKVDEVLQEYEEQLGKNIVDAMDVKSGEKDIEELKEVNNKIQEFRARLYNVNKKIDECVAKEEEMSMKAADKSDMYRFVAGAILIFIIIALCCAMVIF